jgi:hypothetical protein
MLSRAFESIPELRDRTLERDPKFSLGDGLTRPELYHWAVIKRNEMRRDHRDKGHAEKYGFCATCDNCFCPMNTRWPCRCAEGKRQLTPYRIRFQRRRDADRAGMKLPDYV